MRASKLGHLDVICRGCESLVPIHSDRIVRSTEDVESVLKRKGWKNADTLSPICPECARAGSNRHETE